MNKKLNLLLSLLISVFILGTLSACSTQADVKLSDNPQTTTADAQNSDDKTQNNQQQQEEKVYKIGDKIEVNDKYELTITKVSLTKERNEFEEKQPQKVAVIDYNYKNINNDEDLFISSVNFKVYGEEGNALEEYPAGADKVPQSIAKGKQCSAQMSYGFDKGTKLELQFYDNPFNDNADTKFIVDVK